MTTLADLRPGDLGFCNIDGRAGALVKWGQWLLAKTEPDEVKINHVLVVTGAGEWPHAVQAEPGGATEVALTTGYGVRDFVYLRPDYARWNNESFRVNAGGLDVARAAQQYIGIPYSFADYAALLGYHLGIDAGPIRRYVTDSRHMICSQLADQSLTDAGFHTFTDGRLPQDVMPIELYRAILARPGTQRLVIS